MTLTQLQKQIELLTDEINDIFHATELNFDAIKIHLQIQQPTKNDPKSHSQIKHPIAHCQNEFNSLKNAYKQRTNLRLEYLINEQIKSEQDKVRRQRLLEYQDKIYDHRRLICDKESFYDSLIKPKSKRPPGMTSEQFQELKLKDFQNQEKENLRLLEEETQILLKLEKFLRNYRLTLEEEFNKYQTLVRQQAKISEGKDKNEDKIEEKQQQRQQQEKKSPQNLQKSPENQKGKQITAEEQKAKVQTLMNSTPTLYSKYENLEMIKMTPQAFQVAKKLVQQCLSLSQNEAELQKEYKEEREMYKYLKWEQSDLIKKYKKLQDQIKELRTFGQNQKKRKTSL